MQTKATRSVLADVEKRRLLALEAQTRTREHTRAVNLGVAEGVALGQARGEEFAGLAITKAGRQEPVRRLSGLAWLRSQGKLGADTNRAGILYGDTYRASLAVVSIKSGLNDTVGGGDSDPVSRAYASANRRLTAGRALVEMRRKVGNVPSLVKALDLICGEERTPRQAGGNGTEAAVYTALVLAALDLLVGLKGTH